MNRITSPFIEVKKSRIHNNGIFAKKDIPKGTRIIEYVGEKVTKAEAEKRADIVLELSRKSKTKGAVYIFNLNKKYDIDGNVTENTARYINHSCDPNCETEIINDRIWVIAARDIKKEEELSYNYGYDIDVWDEHPCKCGSRRCVGYILDEEEWPKLKRRLAYRKRKAFA